MDLDKWLSHSLIASQNKLRKLDEQIAVIEHLTGCSIDILVDKLKAGWTLTPPEKNDGLKELEEAADEFQ